MERKGEESATRTGATLGNYPFADFPNGEERERRKKPVIKARKGKEGGRIKLH